MRKQALAPWSLFAALLGLMAWYGLWPRPPPPIADATAFQVTRPDGSSTVLLLEPGDAVRDTALRLAPEAGPSCRHALERLLANPSRELADHDLRYAVLDGGSCAVRRTLLPTSMEMTLGRPLDLNDAGSEDLVALPFIGPAKAAAIIEDRQSNGPFTCVEDLDRVKGIGMKTVEKLRRFVTVRGATR